MVGFVVRSGGSMEAHPVECFYAHKGEAKAETTSKSAAQTVEDSEQTDIISMA
jgi:hypothetical protein